MPGGGDPHFLVGLETSDDAGVFQISEHQALVQTADFITPIVDDPYDFGQIAAANALSDVYAMGANPLTALNLVGFPIEAMDREVLSYIIKGGWDKARDAEVTIVGGHSVKDPEIKYGLAVTGTVLPSKIIRNSTARAGDKLILTKPLGTGILATALKNEKLPDELLSIITASMKRLNRKAAQVMITQQAHACTDITGYGLLGHLLEMMNSSGTTATLFAEKVPLFPELQYFVEKKQIPGGLKDNLKFIEPHLEAPPRGDDWLVNVFCDPQTSGGLLFTVSAESAGACLQELHQSGETDSSIIGEIVEKAHKPILLE